MIRREEPYGKPLSAQWRLEHVKAGDEFLNYAERPTSYGLDIPVSARNLFIQLAQAHYLAANVRARFEAVKSDD